MQIHKEIFPGFVTSFKCVGPDCLISCCQGWSIHIDKKTHQSYITSPDTAIRALAKKSLLPLKGGKARYSLMTLNENHQCPFIDCDRLCTIHRTLGEKALSKTCATYPRLKMEYQGETRHSLTLSCPEAARLVLFDPQSMLLEERSALRGQAKKPQRMQHARFSQSDRVIQLFAWNIIQSPSLSVEENLMALAHFIIYLQRIEFDIENRIGEVENYFNQLLEMLQSGKSVLSTTSNESVVLKLQVLSSLGSLVTRRNSRSEFLGEGHRLLIDFMESPPCTNMEDLRARLQQLNEQWQSVCANSCLSEPHVLRNYLLYLLYRGNFPGTSRDLVLRKLYHLILNYYYFRQVIAVRSLREEITVQTVSKTLAIFSENTMHSSVFDAEIDEVIDLINGGDDLSCLLLLI